MLRAFLYVVTGWVLVAVAGGLADVFGLTIVVPATSVVVVTHAASTGERQFIPGLAVAVALGYIEDLHQGAPIGTLSMALVLTFVGLHKIAGRIALQRWVTRTLVVAVAVVALDAITLGLLVVFGDRFGFAAESLLATVQGVQWHVFATVLALFPIWRALDRIFAMARVDPDRRSDLHLDVR